MEWNGAGYTMDERGGEWFFTVCIVNTGLSRLYEFETPEEAQEFMTEQGPFESEEATSLALEDYLKAGRDASKSLL